MLAESSDDPKAAWSACLINRHFITYAAHTLLVSLLRDRGLTVAVDSFLNWCEKLNLFLMIKSTNPADKPVQLVTNCFAMCLSHKLILEHVE